jgi:hypothetical protein
MATTLTQPLGLRQFAIVSHRGPDPKARPSQAPLKPALQASLRVLWMWLAIFMMIETIRSAAIERDLAHSKDVSHLYVFEEGTMAKRRGTPLPPTGSLPAIRKDSVSSGAPYGVRMPGRRTGSGPSCAVRETT